LSAKDSDLIFKYLDIDNSKSITDEEINVLDKNGDRNVSKEEISAFLAICRDIDKFAEKGDDVHELTPEGAKKFIQSKGIKDQKQIDKVIKKLDADDDRKITAQEISMMDKDNDGKITSKEILDFVGIKTAKVEAVEKGKTAKVGSEINISNFREMNEQQSRAWFNKNFSITPKDADMLFRFLNTDGGKTISQKEINALDKNGDKSISRAEIDSFLKLIHILYPEYTKDGYLTPEQTRNYLKSLGIKDAKVQDDVIKKLDVDGDKQITVGEISKMDKDGDGQITKEEVNAFLK